MAKHLRCYFAGSKYPGDHVYVEACFAHSHREAKAILWREGSELNAACDGNYFDMTVRRHEQFEHLAEKYEINSPGVINDDRIAREMGWSCDGDARCAKCELAEFDGRHPLCEQCEQCDECGHHNDCPEHGKEVTP